MTPPGDAPAFNLWFLVIGGLLVVMALTGSVLKRLPLSASLLYLLAGVGLAGHGLLRLNPIEDAHLLERLAEIAVLISLFTTGLKLSPPLNDRRWHIPGRLAFVSMTITIGLIALAGIFLLGLPAGAAVLLGALLAPTDPVLASDVQVEDPGDRDRLRFGLTGEAGLNDGTAFPFVMLGLGLLGLHPLGAWGVRWLLVDVLWAIAAGLGIGYLCGLLIGKLVLYLRAEHKEAVGADEFLTLGLIALSYGAALLLHAYGFLAVLAAGLALRRIERSAAGEDAPSTVKAAAAAGSAEEIATDPEQAPAYLTGAVLSFNEQLERIGEITLVLVVGGLLAVGLLPREAAWFAPLLFCVIRPISVGLGLIGARVGRRQRWLMGWFGIRGIGSVYYLMFAITHGLPDDLARRLAALTLTVIAASILVHGISVTPLMSRYAAARR
jgi:NhaP-type Na+/H+ or K+/H+ antiporter